MTDTTIPGPARQNLDLDVAIRVAQKMLAAYSDSSRDGFSYPEAYGSLAEALRILLHALGAEPDSRSEGRTATMAVRLPGASQKVPDTGELPEPLYGGDVDQFVSDAYDSLADSDLDAEPGEGQ